VISENITADAVSLKTTGWASGWYLVTLEGHDGRQARGRLLVRE